MAWELSGNAGTGAGTDFLGTTDQQPLVIKTNGTEVVRVNVAGVDGSLVQISAQDGLSVNGFQPFLTLRDGNSGNARSIVQGVDGHLVFIPDSFAGSGAAMVIRTGTGNVGIGTSDPSSRLEIVGQDGMAVTGFQPFITLRDSNAGNARACIQGVNGDIVLIPNSFIGGGAAMVIRTGTGDVDLSGNLSLAAGKDIVLTGADCAEQFDIVDADASQPGAVMVINEDGALDVCRSAYDRNVAGVVSGAGEYQPGIILGRRQTDHAQVPIALAGRVYCQVDAEYAPIAVGDVLTTSPTVGHAMRATEPDRAFGSVLGKALRALPDGRGLIPMLVALH